jgi:hypothetical protein
MITQQEWRKDVAHKKFVIGVHSIIQFFVDQLKIPEIIGTYIQQDRRLRVPVEQTLMVLIHNILTTPTPMYEIADWLAPMDEACLGLSSSDATHIHA